MKNESRYRWGWLTAIIVVGCCIVLLWGTAHSRKVEKPMQLKRFNQLAVKFNTPVNLVFYTSSPQEASEVVKEALDFIDQMEYVFTDYQSESELRQLCDRSDGKTPIKVSEPLFRVLERAAEVSESSEGAFDVTIGPVVRLWRRAIRHQVLPDPEKLDEARKLVGYELIHLDPQNRTVLLEKPGMRLDVGGIAKGYIIDEVLAIFRRRGIDRALVDIGGDMALGNAPPGKKGWTVSIAPLEGLAPDGSRAPFCRLTLANCAVATSGDTERFVEIDGRRYSHLIDPKTGIGITDHSNVTVIARDAITADALASAVSILGPDRGLKLIERTPDTKTLILRRPADRLEVYRSWGFGK